MPYKEFEIAGIGCVKLYKRRGSRSIRLTVTPDGQVRVTMPSWTPYQTGAAFALSRKAWIAAQARPSARSILTHGMPVGKAHHLVFRRDPAARNVRTNIRQTEIIVTCDAGHGPDDPDVQAAAQKACLRALRRQAMQLLGRRLQQLAALHDITYQHFTVKRMTSRWGSCDQQGNIVLNIFLVQLPWELIDYVILHELAHRHVLHHGPQFWQELERLLPDAKKRRKVMRTQRPTLSVLPSAGSVA